MMELVSKSGSGYFYKVAHTLLSVAASAQDFFSITAPANCGVIVHDIHIFKTGAGATTLDWGHTDGTSAGAVGDDIAGSVKPTSARTPPAACTYRVKDTTRATVLTTWGETITVPGAGTWTWRNTTFPLLPHGERWNIVCPPSSTLVVGGTPGADDYIMLAWIEEIRV